LFTNSYTLITMWLCILILVCVSVEATDIRIVFQTIEIREPLFEIHLFLFVVSDYVSKVR